MLSDEIGQAVVWMLGSYLTLSQIEKHRLQNPPQSRQDKAGLPQIHYDEPWPKNERLTHA